MPRFACLALLLVALAGSPGQPAAELPPRGSVDLGALVAAFVEQGPVGRLAAVARTLRALAEEVPEAETPPAPDPASLDRAVPQVAAADRGAATVELQLLADALGDHLLRDRQRERSMRAVEVVQALAEAAEARRQEQLAWERSVALQQRFERINLELQLAQPTLAPDVAERLRRELALLSAVTDGVDAARRRAAATAAIAERRRQAAELEATLAARAAVLRQEGEALVARRESDLAADAQRLAAARAAGEQRRTPTVDLELGEWRQVLEVRAGSAEGRGDAQRQAYLATAGQLEQAASAYRERSLATARGQVLAWLRVIERRAGVRLETRAIVDVPDLTGPVAELIAALAADPAALSPPQEVPEP